MCTHFPALFGDSKRLLLRDFIALRQQLNSIRGTVEQRGVTALPCGIQDDRRSIKDKVELLPRYPGSQIFVANRYRTAIFIFLRMFLTWFIASNDSIIEGIYILIEG
jgi:hypothetical protein